MKQHAEGLSKAIARLAEKIGRPIRIMEVCGTHTVALFRHGIRGVLPQGITLLSGPGCPVCVTSVKDVDMALALAARKDVVLYTFGDMMRVRGGVKTLFDARAEGADVRIAYSPLECLKAAEAEPSKKVVFFATGFETTSPLVAGTLVEAHRRGIENFYVHSVHKLVPPAMRALLDSGESRVDAFLLPGHVCSMTGTRPFEFLARKYKVPSVIAGFSAMDILEGIVMILEQISDSQPELQIQYVSVVRPEGNPRAMETLYDAFAPAPAYWRGIGSIPESGLMPQGKYAHYDAVTGPRALIDPAGVPEHAEPRGCSCGEVLRGIKVPTDCPLFGKTCTPERPVGACMVSTEGSCSAYYKYGGYGA